jgi:hypothetical protein
MEILRLKECGLVSGQDAIDINFAHDHWVGKEELGRIAKLELLDEMEEWCLLASHYCIAWGWRINGGNKPHGFEDWTNIKNAKA